SIVFGDQVSAHVPIASLLSLLAAAVCAAETNIVVKKLPAIDPVATNTVAMTVGPVFLLGVSFLTGEAHDMPSRTDTWVALAYLMTAGTLGGFILFLLSLGGG